MVKADLAVTHRACQTTPSAAYNCSLGGDHMMRTRRDFVRGAGTASLLLGMPAVIQPSWAETSGASALRNADLPTPDFAALRGQAEFLAGVRPHRTGGVRLSLTPIQNGQKYLIHNYGHSGA